MINWCEEYIGVKKFKLPSLMEIHSGQLNLYQKIIYDYKAKYTKGAKTKHVMPAKLKKKGKEVLNMQKNS